MASSIRPSRSLDWVLIDKELHWFFNAEAREMSAFLYGRRMYELMVDYWPSAETDPAATPAMVEFARIWKDKPKAVFSRTLGHVDRSSRLIRDDAAEEVARLKAQPGIDMDVGGPTTASTFMRLGLIDEYRLFTARWHALDQCGARDTQAVTSHGHERPVMNSNVTPAFMVNCPRCHAEIEPLPIVYGFPSPDLFEAAEAGRVRLGGCLVGDEAPDFACPSCLALLPWVAHLRQGLGPTKAR